MLHISAVLHPWKDPAVLLVRACCGQLPFCGAVSSRSVNGCPSKLFMGFQWARQAYVRLQSVLGTHSCCLMMYMMTGLRPSVSAIGASGLHRCRRGRIIPQGSSAACREACEASAPLSFPRCGLPPPYTTQPELESACLSQGALEPSMAYRGQTATMEKALLEASIPFKIVGGTTLLESTLVKDALAYCRLALNLNDDPSFMRILNKPARKLGAGPLLCLFCCMTSAVG